MDLLRQCRNRMDKLEKRIQLLEKQIVELNEVIQYIQTILHTHGNAISGKLSAGDAEMIIRSLINEQNKE